MQILKCKMCGGDLNVAENEKVVECEYCGSKQTVPDTNDEKKVNLYNRANRLRMACEFDKAGAIYEQIIAEFPEESEAYWGLCLCNYGIEYVDDPATANKIPTCHRASFEKMCKDENYELALENADMSARIVYEDQAKEIDRIMGEILSVSKDEEPYDIFICYKETDNIGSRTPDSVLAQDIYDNLTEKGYKVFFSRITLEDKLGTQYEPYIFSALNSAKVMLVVGTDYEYLNAVWVKNEWSRFLKLMAKDKTKVLIPCYKDMDVYDMPDEFKGLQSQDCTKLGFVQDLTRGIDKLFGKNENHVTSQAVNVNNGTQSLLGRAFMFLEDGEWDKADEYCEKVLDIDPKNAEAYLGKLMEELKVRKKEELKNEEDLFDDSMNYKKAVCFGSKELVAELEEDINYIKYNFAYKYLKECEKNEEFLNNSAEDFLRVSERFKEIGNYRDSAVIAEQSREKAENIKQTLINQKAEAQNIFAQLIEALENYTPFETVQEKLNVAKRKKEELGKLYEIQLSQFEIDKNNVISKATKLSELKEKIQSLTFQKEQLEKNISSEEKHRVSLGVFAISQKKELARNIKELNAKKKELDDEIIAFQEELNSIANDIESLDSTEEIERKAEAIKSENAIQCQCLDDEIRNLEEKLVDESQNGIFSKIEREIETKRYIFDFINNEERLEKIRTFSYIPIRIVELLKTPILFGSYPQSKNGEKKPIEWQILAKEGNKLLLISKYVLDCQQYQNKREGNTWENSSLRNWLNSTFLNNAFSTEEQAQIENITVSADKNPLYDINPGNSTIDKVFLLSIAEVKKYFSSSEARVCEPTTFAVAQGAFTMNEDDLMGTFWWLRSPGCSQDFVAEVSLVGSLQCEGESGVTIWDEAGVRPALWINLDS